MIIHIGTKGQLIKMAPVIWELRKRDIPFQLFYTPQQEAIMRRLTEQFHICPYPHVSCGDITSVGDVLWWWYENVDVFDPTGHKWLITHGDTLSTLMSCYLARRHHMQLIHVESGLRSYSYLHPFPEEMIRRLVVRTADVLFCPGTWAYNNVKHLLKTVINTQQNTVYDTLRWIAAVPKVHTPHRYVIFAIHRQETIYNFHRLMKCVELACTIHHSHALHVIWIMHTTTAKKLEEYNLLKTIHWSGIKVASYINYIDFMRLVARAEYVVSDGGGLQEECSYLNVPLLIMRNATERHDGLNQVSYLSKFDTQRIKYFLRHVQDFKMRQPFVSHKPSKIIVDWIEENIT